MACKCLFHILYPCHVNPDCFIIAAIISSLSLTPRDASAGNIKESRREIITRRTGRYWLRLLACMDFQVEPCCNYLCKLKDVSRRLSSCERAYNFIRAKIGNQQQQRCNLRWWIFQESFQGVLVWTWADSPIREKQTETRPETEVMTSGKKIK